MHAVSIVQMGFMHVWRGFTHYALPLVGVFVRRCKTDAFMGFTASWDVWLLIVVQTFILLILVN